MNRRKFMQAAAIAPAVPALAVPAAVKASLTTKVVRLNLQHTWTTTMSSSQYRDTIHVAYRRDGLTGHGEGAPIVRYKEDALGAQKAIESIRDLLLEAEPMQFSKTMATVFKRIQGEWAAHEESGRRVKTYALTASGRAQLAKEKRNWERVHTAVMRVLTEEP